MIKVYDYYGLILFFSETDALPIRIHAGRNKAFSYMELNFENGLLKTPLQIAPDLNALDAEDQKTFIKIVERNAAEIVKLWLDCFIYKKEIICEIIQKKID